MLKAKSLKNLAFSFYGLEINDAWSVFWGIVLVFLFLRLKSHCKQFAINLIRKKPSFFELLRKP